jgi:hypothetical protein
VDSALELVDQINGVLAHGLPGLAIKLWAVTWCGPAAPVLYRGTKRRPENFARISKGERLANGMAR